MASIQYPKPLKIGDTIGITAPSSGVGCDAHLKRLELVENQLIKRGYKIQEGRCLREDKHHVSASAKDRANDFMNLWENENIQAILPPWGGEFLIEVLPYLNFKKLKTHPKWISGFSDLSTFHFSFTLATHTASIHSANLMDLIDNQTYDITNKHFHYLSLPAGSTFEQKSYPKYQIKYIPFEKDVSATFQPTETTQWKRLWKDQPCEISGRLIGGCLDTLIHLLGTPYDKFNQFKNDFKKDGIVFYLENCQLDPCHFYRALWQMKLAGYFENLNGIIFGRSAANDAIGDNVFNFEEALKGIFHDAKFPVIWDADIGHRAPQMFIINGAIAHLKYENNTAVLTQKML